MVHRDTVLLDAIQCMATFLASRTATLACRYTHTPLPPRLRLLCPACCLQESAALRAFCTRGTYIRYLRARHWSVKKAAKVGAVPALCGFEAVNVAC